MRKRWIQIDGKLVEVSQDFTQEPRSAVQIIGDIKPYISMIDGSEITSRSRHREHLRSHGCIEVGNDSSLTRPPKPIQSPPGLKDAIIRAVNQVERKQNGSR